MKYLWFWRGTFWLASQLDDFFVTGHVRAGMDARKGKET